MKANFNLVTNDLSYVLIRDNKKMYIIILFILLTTSIFAQTETLVASVLHSAISGQCEYYRMKDRELASSPNQEWKPYSEKWHNLQFLEVGSAIAIGGSIALTSDDLYDIVKQSFMVGVVRWVVRDGVYNINQGNGVFYRSPNTTAITEPFGLWYVKLGILTIILLWNYL